MPDEAALSFPILLTLRVCVACVLLYLCVGLPCARSAAGGVAFWPARWRFW